MGVAFDALADSAADAVDDGVADAVDGADGGGGGGDADGADADGGDGGDADGADGGGGDADGAGADGGGQGDAVDQAGDGAGDAADVGGGDGDADQLGNEQVQQAGPADAQAEQQIDRAEAQADNARQAEDPVVKESMSRRAGKFLLGQLFGAGLGLGLIELVNALKDLKKGDTPPGMTPEQVLAAQKKLTAWVNSSDTQKWTKLSELQEQNALTGQQEYGLVKFLTDEFQPIERQQGKKWVWTASEKLRVITMLSGMQSDDLIYVTLRDYRYNAAPILFSVGCEVAGLALVNKHYKNDKWDA
jgi:hypothetical protein